MPDTPFTVHKHDDLALNRNVAPIPECRVVPVLQNGKVIKAVDVKILSCASVWLRCQQEAERWISDCDGASQPPTFELRGIWIALALRVLAKPNRSRKVQGQQTSSTE